VTLTPLHGEEKFRADAHFVHEPLQPVWKKNPALLIFHAPVEKRPLPNPSLRGALATKQSRILDRHAALRLAMTSLIGSGQFLMKILHLYKSLPIEGVRCAHQPRNCCAA